MREKKKLDTHSYDSTNVKIRKWAFYDAMTFLTPCVAPRDISSNVPPSSEETKTNLDTDDDGLNDAYYAGSVETTSNDVDEEEISTSAMKQPSFTAKKISANKKRRCELQSDVDEQLVGELQKLREQAVSRREEESDSDRQFLLSLLPLMKQLSPMDNLDIKIEIQQAFRRKFAANDKYSFGYRPVQQQNPSKPLKYAQQMLLPCVKEKSSSCATETPYS